MGKKLGAIAKKYGIDLMILFGSIARDRARSTSDIDIGVRFKRSISLPLELKLRAELQQLFDREVDLVDLRRAGALLLGQIAKDAKLLSGSRRDFLEFKIYAQKVYFDFEPYFKLQEASVRRKIRSYAG